MWPQSRHEGCSHRPRSPGATRDGRGRKDPPCKPAQGAGHAWTGLLPSGTGPGLWGLHGGITFHVQVGDVLTAFRWSPGRGGTSAHHPCLGKWRGSGVARDADVASAKATSACRDAGCHVVSHGAELRATESPEQDSRKCLRPGAAPGRTVRASCHLCRPAARPQPQQPDLLCILWTDIYQVPK